MTAPRSSDFKSAAAFKNLNNDLMSASGVAEKNFLQSTQFPLDLLESSRSERLQMQHIKQSQ